MREGWRRFGESEPGNRFQDLHRRRREVAGFGLRSIVVLAAGVGLLFVAVLLMVIPGPGLLVLFFGLGIIASEVLLTARFMDWAEVRAPTGRGPPAVRRAPPRVRASSMVRFFSWRL